MRIMSTLFPLMRSGPLLLKVKTLMTVKSKRTKARLGKRFFRNYEGFKTSFIKVDDDLENGCLKEAKEGTKRTFYNIIQFGVQISNLWYQQNHQFSVQRRVTLHCCCNSELVFS